MSNLKYSETIPTTGRRRLIKREYECLPEKAKWLIYENQIKLNEQMPVSRKTEIDIFSGVEALKYLGPTRKFVENMFSITTDDLDVLLYLYPFNFFTKSDYNRIAVPFIKCNSISSYVKRGLVVQVFSKESLIRPNVKRKDSEGIFALSLKSKRAVVYFYKILGKDLKPFHFKTATYSKSETKTKLIKDLLNEMRDDK